jgi:HSP20 family molecular chaperone IbpA
MSNPKKFASGQPLHAQAGDIILEPDDFLDRLSLTWSPHVDICEGETSLTVRVEVPGVDARDVRVTIQDGSLRVQGNKRESTATPKLLCYYCVERRYGRFDRRIAIDLPIDARRASATLESGILTVEIPKLQDRGQQFEIPITKS